MIKKEYLQDIQILTGFTIILVVMGHMVTGVEINSPGIEWYKYLKKMIYSFHMPLFIFISGLILRYSQPQILNVADYRNYIKKKIIRLLPSYIFFALIIYIAKILLSTHLKVDNSVSFGADFFKIFYYPTKSFAGYLWYVYVLLLYYTTIPILLKIFKTHIVLLISIPISFLSFPSLFALDFFFNLLPFCLLGCLVSENIYKYQKFIKKYAVIFIGAFITICAIYYFYGFPKFLMGLISIPAFHGLILQFKSKHLRLLNLIGKYTFAIYLMNTIVIGFIKAIFFKYLGFNYQNFEVLFVILLVCGVTVPILIKIYIINFIPIIKKHIA